MEILRYLVWFVLSWSRITWSGWQDNLRPRMFLQPRLYTDYQIFEGNKTDPDNFEVILVDGDHVLVGGKNSVYKLQIKDLKLRQVLEWNSSEQDKNVCLVKGKSEAFCQNYIKVLKKFENDEGRYLICGTNAFKPECREYVEDAGTYLMTKKSKGVGMCPYSPEHNSTSVLVDDQLYSGTAADYQGVDPIIYRDPLRTPQFDSTYLNNPSFVGSFDDQDFVYFFFREGAVEYMNCGKSVFSRVARVCKNDLGGTRSLNAKWTSFLKARLNCSVPGNYPFYFDEIQDISNLIKGNYGDEIDTVIYGVFRTAPNSISGSAVCAFRLRDISAVFEGQFKEQRSTSDNWLAVEHHKVPSPRPVTVVNTKKGSGHVIVTSADEMRSVALYRCDKARTCVECVALQDPYCAWDVREDKCSGAQSWPKGSQGAFLQSVPTGRHPECPGGQELPPIPQTRGDQPQRMGTVINQVQLTASKSEAPEQRQDNGGHRTSTNSLMESENPTIEASVVLFSLETLIITVSAGAVAALVVGFVTGYCCGRKCGKEESNVPYTDAEYEYFEQRQLPARPLTAGGVAPQLHPLLQHTDKRPAEEQVYAEPILVNHHVNTVNTSNPLGTTLGSKAYAPSSAIGGGGMTLVGGVGAGVGFHHPNKFNTISNIHKRGGGGGHLGRSLLSDDSHSPGFEPVNHYEKSSILLNRRPPGMGGLVGGDMGVVGGTNTVYHMGTISRASKQNNADKNQQVVDSAYGTTRSVKKVYL